MTITKHMNGNLLIEIQDDGTKTREYAGEPQPEFPESIDVKITNKCDGGCPYCHEESTIDGREFDQVRALELLKGLPSGTELAIGGGDPLSVEGIEGFLQELKDAGLIVNITVNAKHTRQYHDKILNLVNNSLIKGLGISYVSSVKVDKELVTENTVFHLIMGVHRVWDIDKIKDLYGSTKVLILGFKQKGRGATYPQELISDNIIEWNQWLGMAFTGAKVVSFDNLAIEQLGIKNRLDEETWNQFYMGDDGQFTMYLDLVERVYAKSSTSLERPWIFPNKTIKDCFRDLLSH